MPITDEMMEWMPADMYAIHDLYSYDDPEELLDAVAWTDPGYNAMTEELRMVNVFDREDFDAAIVAAIDLALG